jgi:hypothetical protein
VNPIGRPAPATFIENEDFGDGRSAAAIRIAKFTSAEEPGSSVLGLPDRAASISTEMRRRSPRDQGAKMEKPTQEQIEELRKLSKEARVTDWSEIVRSKEEAEIRIRDLKAKSRIE